MAAHAKETSFNDKIVADHLQVVPTVIGDPKNKQTLLTRSLTSNALKPSASLQHLFRRAPIFLH